MNWSQKSIVLETVTLETQLPCVHRSSDNGWRGKFPGRQSKSKSMEKREAEIRQIRKKVGWIQSELAKQKSSGRLTPKQRKIRHIVCKLCGSKSGRRLKVFLQTQKYILRVKVEQVRRHKTVEGVKRSDGVKVLGKKAKLVGGNTNPTETEIKEYWGTVRSPWEL